MNISKSNYCIILAGGRGKRLWPSSRMERPKQFLDFFGTGRTQLQDTFCRMTSIVPKENIYVCTCKEYEHWVHEQLPELQDGCLMIEPINRNTAGSVAWAMLNIQKRDENASIVIVPSDQYITGEDAFKRNVIDGLDLVGQKDMVLVMGIKPTRPEPGYGYIQIGDYADFDDIYKVKSFTEKPERDFARMFMESGEWYWNTGMFLSNVHYLGMCLYKFLPVVLRNFDEIKSDWTIQEEVAYVQENFSRYPNLSIDLGILEKSDNVYVKKCEFGWADMGTWHGIYEAMQKSNDDNVIINSDTILEDSHNNIIKLPEGKLAVINGLDGYIVAEKDNVLLICKKEDSSALIRKYVTEVQIKKGEKFI